MDIKDLTSKANELISVIEAIEIENEANRKNKENLKQTISDLIEKNKSNKEAYDIATHAIEILNNVSDQAVSKAYGFLEKSLNNTLEKTFTGSTRKIEIKEYTFRNQYPQLEFVLHVGNGKTRSLKNDSGHGIAQIVSLLSILCLIVITGSRRLLVIDEVLSGVSVHNRKIIDDILWTFTGIGFQFIVNEHGFIPRGSHVYYLEMVGDVSGVKQDYIANKGIYLQGNSNNSYNYYEPSDNENDSIEQEIETEHNDEISTEATKSYSSTSVDTEVISI